MRNKSRLPSNAEGSFFVNTACINCDTCRQLAPDTYAEKGGYSAVVTQPGTSEQQRLALHALLACPTAAIESNNKAGISEALEDFPLPIEEGVYYCGFTSDKSFGGSSYFVVHPDGNWLVDSPRYVPALVKKFELLGGIRYIFLTHRDDVADAGRYAEHFRAERIIHVLERQAQPDAEHMIDGTDIIDWFSDFRIIPTPGHTRGHMVLLYRQRYLFTGDHLEWDRDTRDVEADPYHCWYSWSEQANSMERLAQETFEWVLPGHGQRGHLPAQGMKGAMLRLVERMRGVRGRA